MFTQTIEGRPVAEFTVSWLPCNFGESLHLSMLPTSGRNYSHEETMSFAVQQGLMVRCWGPCEIDGCVFISACRQFHHLNSGQVGYQLFEPINRLAAYYSDGGALHCSHAVTDIVGLVHTGTTRGYEAGAVAASLLTSHRGAGSPQAR